MDCERLMELEIERMLSERYFNYDYEKKEYYEIREPMHDHYTYNYEDNAWYEKIIKED